MPFEIPAGENLDFDVTLDFGFLRKRDVDIQVFCGVKGKLLTKRIRFLANIKPALAEQKNGVGESTPGD